MDNVVYLLGAGFSAPLGLPVMNNFLVKSKDLYFEDKNRYSHFVNVFDTISELSIIKNYFSSDLFNIEEILSILEMKESLQGSTLPDEFKMYITDVIESYTPNIIPVEDYPGNWQDFIFGKDQLWKLYGNFVASLIGLVFTQNMKPSNENRTPNYKTVDAKEANYSVITLNYDRVIENLIGYLNDNHLHKRDIYIINNHDRKSTDDRSSIYLPLAKLHGSINEEIVPPTWSKSVSDSILNSWKLAFRLLSNANQLRILGYSLPTADAYVKYLLKSGVLASEHLKQIDIICLDPNKAVRERYNNFIDFKYYRFANANIVEYLHNLERDENKKGIHRRPKMSFPGFEDQHQAYMQSKAS